MKREDISEATQVDLPIASVPQYAYKAHSNVYVNLSFSIMSLENELNITQTFGVVAAASHFANSSLLSVFLIESFCFGKATSSMHGLFRNTED
jgi:hypothetical protein